MAYNLVMLLLPQNGGPSAGGHLQLKEPLKDALQTWADTQLLCIRFTTPLDFPALKKKWMPWLISLKTAKLNI